MNLDARPPAAALDPGLAALAHASSEIVCIVSASEQLLLINRAGRAALGFADDAGDAAADGPLAAYLAAGDRAAASDVLSDVLRSGQSRVQTLHFARRDSGALTPIACTIARLPVRGERCACAAIVGHLAPGPDAWREREAAHDAAERARLMELLIGVVGHDLRNPLNAIITCAHFVAKQSEVPGARALMARIIGSGQRMQRMIEQLLDFTRVRAGGIPLRTAAADFRAIVEAAAGEIRVTHPGCPIAIETQGDPTGVWDPDRAAQLVSNLLGNAAAHGEGGVRVAIDGTRAGEIRVTFSNGGAIPPEILPLLFNPFRVVHQRGEGSGGLGLGLYVTRQIALAHGGDVRASSDATGTRVEVRLPRRPGAGPQADEPGAEIHALERLAAPPVNTSVTAQLFGAAPLHERVPQIYWEMFERYGRALDAALEHQTYKRVAGDFSGDLRTLAEQLADLGAGAREVAELHSRALRQRMRSGTFARAQAYTAEGRLVSFELMGHLLSAYRRRAGLGPGGQRG